MDVKEIVDNFLAIVFIKLFIIVASGSVKNQDISCRILQ